VPRLLPYVHIPFYSHQYRDIVQNTFCLAFRSNTLRRDRSIWPREYMKRLTVARDADSDSTISARYSAEEF
jgi:hypothetical protein